MITQEISYARPPLPRDLRSTSLAILIVDDDETDRRRLSRLLRKAGLSLEIREAADLGELRRALDMQSFDFVFLDYRIGIETGRQALHLVTSHEDQEQAIPIMVTSVGAPDIIIESMRSGCADYLIKDELGPEIIRKSLLNALERQVLLAAISRHEKVRITLDERMRRVSQSCAPEMRRILSEMLSRLRKLHASSVEAPMLASDVASLTRSCGDIFGVLDEMQTLFELDATAPAVQA